VKKYITISLSAIFFLVILLLPGNKINAEELESQIYNYDNSTGVVANYEKFSDELEEVRTYMEQYKNDYYYFILFSDSQINVLLRQKSDYVNFYLKLTSSGPTLYLNHTNNAYLKELGFSANVSSFDTNFSTFKTKLESGNLSTTQYGASYSATYLTIGGISSSFQRVYYTNYDNYILSEDSTYNLNLNDSIIVRPGDKIPTYYDYSHISYDHSIELDPNYYNFFYLKFKGFGDLSFFFKHNLTNPKGLYYFLYKNQDKIYTFYVDDNTDLYIEQYLTNSTDDDIYTVIMPFYMFDFEENDLFKFQFTIPGLIEYGTNDYKYTYENDSWVESEANRSDITHLLDPSENKPDEIVSSSTSHNTLSNDSLNEFMWPYSLFARNGNNIKNISLNGSFTSTSAFSLNDFKTNLLINYGEENYKININNCISLGNCNLTKFEQDLIKNILFDRNVENSDYYLDFSVIPQKDLQLSASDQFSFGISINFNSSVELTINSMLLAINDLSNSYYNVYFKLYDSKGQVHTIYKTSLDSNYIGVNQFQLDSRTADIYRVDLMFVYNHTLSSISTTDKYSLKFSEFNIFANTQMIHIYTDNTEITYQTCAWYDMFCHGQNMFTWLIHEAPFASDFWKVFLYITNVFDMLWVIITYIFMPFDIIPPIFGIPMSTILPFILIPLYLIKKLWLGGDD